MVDLKRPDFIALQLDLGGFPTIDHQQFAAKGDNLGSLVPVVRRNGRIGA